MSATRGQGAVDPSVDARFMALALALGRRGLGQTWPNPAVGAVAVRDGADGPIVIARGWTQAGGRPHAETEALERAGAAAAGATLYVTLEPCSHHGKTPPCADAIIAARIARVVSALEDPNPEVAGQGHARMRAAGITIDVGVGAEAARRAHAGHIRRIRDGRPHVLLKLAVSADEKAGLAGRRPADITGRAARQRAHMLRATSDAILIGIGTALADNPLLTCRLPGMAGRSPVRVVLDRGLRTPLACRLVATARTTPLWIVGSTAAPRDREEALHAAGAEVLRVDEAEGRLGLSGVLQALAARGITRLMVEGGPIVAAAFVTTDLVDEAALFRRTQSIGADGIDALEGLPLTAVTQSPRLHSCGIETVGNDTLEMFERTMD
jgi:diaminohydroxyphosphoribosylaminopyrimidine deaminase/5-amino-6-(5-phosphoribosylamino)uracil reductase